MKLSKKAQQSLDKVLSQFKSGDLSPITTVARIQLSKDAPATHWSLSNRILAFSQSGELDCRGYRQWEQVDRKVKKGERSVYILRPIIVKRDDQKITKKSKRSPALVFLLYPSFQLLARKETSH